MVKKREECGSILEANVGCRAAVAPLSVRPSKPTCALGTVLATLRLRLWKASNVLLCRSGPSPNFKATTRLPQADHIAPTAPDVTTANTGNAISKPHVTQLLLICTQQVCPILLRLHHSSGSDCFQKHHILYKLGVIIETI